jgi:hypothetical protein
MTSKNEPRKDETPVTFAELRPPGYWSATLNRFVDARDVHDACAELDDLDG